jgi:hypothetical protein
MDVATLSVPIVGVNDVERSRRAMVARFRRAARAHGLRIRTWKNAQLYSYRIEAQTPICGWLPAERINIILSVLDGGL